MDSIWFLPSTLNSATAFKVAFVCAVAVGRWRANGPHEATAR